MAANLFKPTGPIAGEDFCARDAAIKAVTPRMESGQSVVILSVGACRSSRSEES